MLFGVILMPFSHNLQGTHKEGEFRQLEIWTWKSNVRPPILHNSKQAETSQGFFMDYFRIIGANNYQRGPTRWAITPQIRCARCLPAIRRCCHVICLRVAFCHVIICISSACFSKPASVRVLPVLSVVRSEHRHSRTRPRHLRNIIYKWHKNVLGMG